MTEFLRSIIHRSDEDGASAVEYGLLVAGIAALIVLIVFAFGGIIQGVFKSTCDTVANKGASSASNASCTA